VPQPDIDEHEWAAFGQRMSAIGRASQWWIGDWLRFGVERWGEKYAKAARITGYDVSSLRNMAWLAGEFDLSRRRDRLTWSHHAAVAGLEPEERDIWLTRAENLRMSVSDLRGEIRTAQRRLAESAETSEAEPQLEVARCPTCGQKLPASDVLHDPDRSTSVTFQ
jgi:uncharacterized protein with PIN domain